MVASKASTYIYILNKRTMAKKRLMSCGNSLENTNGATHRQELRQKFYLLLSSLLFEKKRDEQKKMRLLVLVKAWRERKPLMFNIWMNSFNANQRTKRKVPMTDPIETSLPMRQSVFSYVYKCQKSDIIHTHTSSNVYIWLIGKWNAESCSLHFIFQSNHSFLTS